MFVRSKGEQEDILMRNSLIVRRALDAAFEMKRAFFVVIGFILISLVFAACLAIFELNETQAMYYLSSVPQVIAGLVGLTIAGYAIAEEMLKRPNEIDESLEQINSNIRLKFRMLLLEIILIAAVGIVFSLLGIADYSARGDADDWFCRVSLDVSGAALLGTLYLIAVLVWNMSNPNLIQDASNQAANVLTRKKMKSNELSSVSTQRENRTPLAEDELRHEVYAGDNLARFLSGFNQLDDRIVQCARDLGYEKESGRVGIMGAIRYLKSRGYLTAAEYNDLTELISYRNYLVHGTDLRVSDQWLQTLSDVFLKVIGSIRVRMNDQCIDPKSI